MNWTFSGRPGADLHDALRFACALVRPESYLEVGVDGGGSLRVVLSSSPRLRRLALCDIWNPGYCGHGFKNHEHLRRLIPPRVKELRFLDGDSRVLLPGLLLEGRTFDLVTIDGGHDKETAGDDLENGWEMLRRGGILVLDDVGHVNYPHLRELLREFLAVQYDAQLIPEAKEPWRNCAVLQKL